MSDYLRLFRPGGTFFFTVVTHKRRPFLCEPHARHCLRAAIERIRSERPFDAIALVLLPDHFHCIWKLPDDDADFSIRMNGLIPVFISGPKRDITPKIGCAIVKMIEPYLRVSKI
jgi:putative transposase